MEWQWPKIFDNPEMDYHSDLSDSDRRGAALADQLAAWGLCHAAAPRPENFGEVMVRLSEISGATTPDQVSAAAKQWLASR